MNTELSILIKLLEDPDPEVYQTLAQKILDQGVKAIPELENASKASLSKYHFERINQLISESKFRDTKDCLSNWLNSGGVDLPEGFSLVDRVINPDINQSEITNAFGNIRSEIWLELNNRLTALEKIRIVNYFIFEKYGFKISEGISDHPVRFSLSSLAKNRIGSGLSIYAAYAIVSRRLELPVFGVEISGLSLLAYIDLPFTPKAGFDPSQSPILFFIHPEENGRILGLDEVNNFLSKIHSWHLPYNLNACSDSILIRNFAKDLAKVCQKSGKNDLERKIKELLTLWEL